VSPYLGEKIFVPLHPARPFFIVHSTTDTYIVFMPVIRFMLGVTALLLACSGVKHTDPLRREGAFTLRTPLREGYGLLDDVYTTALADIQLDSLDWHGDTSMVLLSAGRPMGGLFQVQTDSSEAPANSYPEQWVLGVTLFATPARFWLRCRDGKHYALLTLDSLRLETNTDSTYTCAGYFRYRLNLDEGERDFR
jgi:hypothetical protein